MKVWDSSRHSFSSSSARWSLEERFMAAYSVHLIPRHQEISFAIINSSGLLLFPSKRGSAIKPPNKLGFCPPSITNSRANYANYYSWGNQIFSPKGGQKVSPMIVSYLETFFFSWTNWSAVFAPLLLWPMDWWMMFNCRARNGEYESGVKMGHGPKEKEP